MTVTHKILTIKAIGLRPALLLEYVLIIYNIYSNYRNIQKYS